MLKWEFGKTKKNIYILTWLSGEFLDVGDALWLAMINRYCVCDDDRVIYKSVNLHRTTNGQQEKKNASTERCYSMSIQCSYKYGTSGSYKGKNIKNIKDDLQLKLVPLTACGIKKGKYKCLIVNRNTLFVRSYCFLCWRMCVVEWYSNSLVANCITCLCGS